MTHRAEIIVQVSIIYMFCELLSARFAGYRYDVVSLESIDDATICIFLSEQGHKALVVEIRGKMSKLLLRETSVTPKFIACVEEVIHHRESVDAIKRPVVDTDVIETYILGVDFKTGAVSFII